MLSKMLWIHSPSLEDWKTIFSVIFHIFGSHEKFSFSPEVPYTRKFFKIVFWKKKISLSQSYKYLKWLGNTMMRNGLQIGNYIQEGSRSRTW